jgi:hypothetical protein
VVIHRLKKCNTWIISSRGFLGFARRFSSEPNRFPKRFERFVCQTDLIVSQNGMAKRATQKRKAAGSAAATQRTQKVFEVSHATTFERSDLLILLGLAVVTHVLPRI